MKKNTTYFYLKNRKRSFKKIKGTISRPRVSVFRSNKHIYAQIIDDTESKTFIGASTIDKLLKNQINKTSTKEAAFFVGIELAKRAIKKGIKNLVFDCGYRSYLGRIKNLAEGLRTQGLNF